MSEPAEEGATACAADGSKSEEEALLEAAIAKQRRLVNDMPSDTTSDVRERAPHAKKLGQLEFRLHLLLEEKRLSSVFAEFESEHGAQYTEPCLLCLDDCYVHADLATSNRFICCGGFTCKRCEDDFRKSKPTKCPLCREPLSKSTAESVERLMAFAEKGAPWAETILGRAMVEGSFGIQKQEQTGLEWINKAVTKNCPAAIFELVKFQFQGLELLSSMPQKECNNLLVKAANLGYGQANSRLAMCLLGGVDGFELDQVEAYYRASVAFALDDTDHNAAQMLGLLHLHRFKFLETSPYLACYYFNISANVGDFAGGQYSSALLSLEKHLHDGDCC